MPVAAPPPRQRFSCVTKELTWGASPWRVEYLQRSLRICSSALAVYPERLAEDGAFPPEGFIPSEAAAVAVLDHIT